MSAHGLAGNADRRQGGDDKPHHYRMASPCDEGNEMTETQTLKTAIVGLIRRAAMEDELLLISTSGSDDGGDAKRWAPAPIVAHNAQFKREQVTRLEAVLHGETPPEFAAVDHTSEVTYRAFAALSPALVAETSSRTTDDLVTSLLRVPEDDLIDPSRHDWLRGRPLWLQVIVRGFWHPLGHVGDWYVANGMTERGVALRRDAVAFTEYLHAPAESQGMAWFSLACTHATVGTTEEAVVALERAATLNHDLRARVATEPELEAIREDRRVVALIG
jgi:hypothetical protein